MEKPKEKSSSIFQAVANRISRFFHKEELKEQTPSQVPASTEPVEPKKVEEPAPAPEPEPVKVPEPEVEISTEKKEIEPAAPQRPAVVRRKRTISKKSKVEIPEGKEDEEIIIPISDLADEEVGPAIHDFVIEHISDTELSVENMSSKLKTSRTGLYGFVRREFGVTPANYILDQRLKYAVSLLEKGMKVREVSLKCGFSDPKYFSKVFKKYYGFLPSNFDVEQ